ncbi:helix-turn-helix domain-containing protein [Embleya sp. NPDC008237]|uniref:helix-turn-helix domain-containing protein n=1 Tax=Embleya sp. NPDC008237 TaxID=3363978 RepID=UPI0036EA22FE
MARQRPPRDLARDPETWPQATIDDIAAAAVQSIARNLELVMHERRLSLRRTALGSGVNRQTIANLLAGTAWPDVATVARLEAFLGAALYPCSRGNAPVAHESQPLRSRSDRPAGTTK